MNAHWQHQPEGGGRIALSLIRWVALHGGRTLTRIFLYPITLYFWLRRAPERRASRAYLTRVLGRPPGAWAVLKHLHAFAAITLDRIFLLTRGERGFRVETEGLPLLDQVLSQGRGVILLGSHHGSFEVLRTLRARRPEVAMRVLLDKQKTPGLTDMLQALAPEVGAGVIDASGDGTSIVLALAEACSEGAIVGLLADRARAREAVRQVPFLGALAPFPSSPWLLAHVLGAPVVLCFGLYLGGNRYRLIFEPVADRVQVPRAGRAQALDALITHYAARLEHYVRLAPYNWFNFYDFWQQDTGPVAGAERLPADADGPAGCADDRVNA